MNVMKVLDELLEFYIGNRGVGYTTGIIEAVQSQSGILITNTQQYAQDIRRQYGNIRAQSIESLEKLRGTQSPIYLDNSAIMVLLGKINGFFIQLTRTIANQTEIINKQRDHIKKLEDELRQLKHPPTIKE